MLYKRAVLFVMATVVIVLGGIAILHSVTTVRARARLVDALIAGDAAVAIREIDSGVALNWTVVVPARVFRHPDTADPIRVPEVAQVTPLMLAAQTGEPRIVAALLGAGANPRSVASDGRSAIDIAVESPTNCEVIRLLYESNGTDIDTLLLRTATFGHAANVECLLGLGANPNGNSGGWATPLHHASRQSDERMARSLLKHGAAVDATDTSGTTPLMWASTRGSREILELLLEAGAEVGAKDKRGFSALAHASEHCSREEVIDSLVVAGADVNARDIEGITPLMKAVENGCAANVRKLLEVGADVTNRDSRGRTALMYVGPYGEPREVLAALLNAGAEPLTEDFAGVSVAQYLQRNGAPVELLDVIGDKSSPFTNQ